MNQPFTVIFDEYGYYGAATSFGRSFGKRSLVKQNEIQERWAARCQKRKLSEAISANNKTAKARKI